ncbi:MAG: hypothetical protein EU549_00785 [Promethearchaeota archaeon]|nr:MAG: hypothetical protein EU549_00785 [Candidatus Lokiarchaeota archaeon]
MEPFELKKILRICEAISKTPKKDASFKNWIEKTIIDLGKKVFENNLTASFNNGSNNILIITTTNKIIQLVKNLEPDKDIYYIKIPSNDQLKLIFKKFLNLLPTYHKKDNNTMVNNKNNTTIIIISFHPMLFDKELILNVYNVRDIQTFIEFFDIRNSIIELKIGIKNKNQQNQIQNNASFINPKTKFLLENQKIDYNIIDLFFNPGIEEEMIKKVILTIKNQLISPLSFI